MDDSDCAEKALELASKIDELKSERKAKPLLIMRKLKELDKTAEACDVNMEIVKGEIEEGLEAVSGDSLRTELRDSHLDEAKEMVYSKALGKISKRY